MGTSIRRSTSRTALVAGGAGFLGAYLCERLIEQDYRVICLDNLRTGSLENLRDLQREPRFSLIEADVCQPLPRRLRVDRIYNMACPASPPHYQADPVHFARRGATRLVTTDAGSSGRGKNGRMVCIDAERQLDQTTSVVQRGHHDGSQHDDESCNDTAMGRGARGQTRASEGH